MNEPFTEEDIQMANKKKVLNIISPQENIIKTMKRYYNLPIRIDDFGNSDHPKHW